MITFFLSKTHEYDKWIKAQSALEKVHIALRLSRIEADGHFGIHKYLENNIWELKWGNGRRIYYAHILEKNILLLLGGNKNGQDKDILRAKKIFKKYIESTD